MTGELLDTRARVKIARKEFAAAEADLTAALTLDRTPLRLFHLALATKGGSPEAAKKHYQEAMERGLREATVHPTDVPAMREMEKAFGAG
jgi:Tfp pilus assembly protein PilF